MAKAAKEEEKQAKLAAKAEADAAKLLAKAAKEEEKQAKLAAKAVEAKAVEADAAKLETKEEEKQAMTVELVGHQSRPTIVAPASDVEEESDQEEKEEEEESDQEVEDTEVEEFTWDGVDYILEPTTGVMYNKDVFLETGDGETVGKYDSLANTVEFV